MSANLHVKDSTICNNQDITTCAVEIREAVFLMTKFLFYTADISVISDNSFSDKITSRRPVCFLHRMQHKRNKYTILSYLQEGANSFF